MSLRLLITPAVSQAVSCVLATRNSVRRVERQPSSSRLQGTCRDEGALLGPNPGEGSEMRCCRTGLLIAILAITSFVPALSQQITITDLDGWLIEATVTREQVNRIKDRESTSTVDQSWSVELGPGLQVKSTSRPQVRGRPEAPAGTGIFRLGEAREVSNFGGGMGRWTLEEGTLTFTRTYVQGAFRAQFVLTRKDRGFDCSAKNFFAREGGTGDVTFWSTGAGTMMTVLRWRQVSDTCRVSKR